MNGVIKNILEEKNFGFIVGSDKQEYFFHRESFGGSWNDLLREHRRSGNIKVEFEASMGQKGPRAEDVRVVSDI